MPTRLDGSKRSTDVVALDKIKVRNSKKVAGSFKCYKIFNSSR